MLYVDMSHTNPVRAEYGPRCELRFALRKLGIVSTSQLGRKQCEWHGSSSQLRSLLTENNRLPKV